MIARTKIGFIGGGNMAISLIGGLLADGLEAGNILVSEPDPERRAAIVARFGVSAAEDNDAVAGQAGALVLAVKPQVLPAVARELSTVVIRHRPLVISIAAGTRTGSLIDWLGSGTAVVRSMPNTPALVQGGATALYAAPGVTDEQRNLAESILRAVGLCVWVDEEEALDVVTALSGSGPAYFFLFMEAMETTAVELGLGREAARLLTLQTALGAARMALESDVDPATLRQRVTSPGGTTERALRIFEEGGLPDLVERAMIAARDRSLELADELGRG